MLRERKTIMKSVGERIAELRKEKNMTQEALAAALNVSSQAISKWENNASMPDISLLPRIADAFDVTVDDLFGRRTKPPKYIRSWEDLPVWIYDLILNNMWDDDMPPRKESFAECVKKHWQTHPNSHSGFVSQNAGAVYACKDLALSYLPSTEDSMRLFESEKAGDFLQFLADKAVRAVLKYQYENRTRSFTAALVASKTGLPEEDVSAAFEKMVEYKLAYALDADIASDKTIRIYRTRAEHKYPMLICPLLTLAERLADFNESWNGFRS